MQPAKNSGCGSGGPSLVANPCNVATGNKYQVETDYVHAQSRLLRFVRQYNSDRLYKGSFGESWRGYFDRRLFFQGTTPSLIKAARADGNAFTFNLVNGLWVGEADVEDRLEQLSSGWRYVRADGGIEEYDATGFLSAMHEGGERLSFVYSTTSTPTTVAPMAGLLITVQDPHGRSMQFTYDSVGRLATMTDPAGGTYTYSYENGHLASVTYPGGAQRRYIHDSPHGAHLLTGIVDENGDRYATWTYDEAMRVTSSEHAGQVERYAFTYATGTTSVTDPRNNTRTYQFETLHGTVLNKGIEGAACPQCGPAATTYDANGNVSSRRDFNGHLTCYGHDLSRNLETVRAEGLTSSTCPSALSGWSPAAGSAERKITTEWHAYWREPVKVAEPKKLTTYVFNGDGGTFCAPAEAKVGEQPIGAICSRTEQATSDDTGAQGTGATPVGAPRTWRYTYNQWGQVLTEDGPRTDVSDVTTYTYDAQGSLASVTNAIGQTTSYANYDVNGRVGQITDPNGLVTTLTYDLRGRLKTRTVGGETTSYTYDGVGQLTQVTHADGTTTSYTYDPAHRLTQITDSAGNRIAYTLDAMGNRTKEETFDHTGVLTRTLARNYDALNRMQQYVGAQ